jgi:predicted TPR repeat methyltransferase
MVLSASQLGIYDELRVQDCCAFLESYPKGSLDLVRPFPQTRTQTIRRLLSRAVARLQVIAADVVEYIGDVAKLFGRVASAMCTGGELIVSAESLEVCEQ